MSNVKIPVSFKDHVLNITMKDLVPAVLVADFSLGHVTINGQSIKEHFKQEKKNIPEDLAETLRDFRKGVQRAVEDYLIHNK